MPVTLRKIVVTAFIILLIFELLLIFRYTEMDVMKHLLGFVLVISFAIFIFSISIQKWNELINPVSLYFLFIFGFGYSLLDLSEIVKPYGFVSIVVIVFSIVFYIIGALINIPFQSPFRSLRFSINSNKIFYYGFLILSFISFLYEIVNIGYLPILKIFSFDVYTDVGKKLVSFIHYFVMLFAIFPAWSYILYKNKILIKKFYSFILILSIFVMLNYLSRQVILVFMLSSLVTYTFYNKVEIRKLVIYGLVIIGFFFLVGQVRMSQIKSIKEKSGTANEMLRAIAGIKHETNLIESTYTLYSSVRYSTLDEYVKKAQKDGYWGLGKYVFRPIVNLTFLDKIGMIKYEPEYNVNFAIATYAIDPFLDFRILGVIVFGFLYGLISTHFYVNFKSGKEQYIISWSIIIFCLIMTPFINYFSTFFIFLVWIINKLIIPQRS